MCQTVHLYHSNKAFVVYCKICEHIQVAFGNFVMTLSIEDYHKFTSYIASTCPHYCSKCFSRNIWIPVEKQKVCLLMSGKEIHEFNAILQVANKSLELVWLLKSINEKQSN